MGHRVNISVNHVVAHLVGRTFAWYKGSHRNSFEAFDNVMIDLVT